MSSLTEEQRRKIEENRRKALERRAALNSGVPPGPVNTTTSFDIGRNIALTVPKPPLTSIQQINKTLQSNSNASQNIPFRGKPLTGTCAMISRDRFRVDIAYNAQVIAVLKSIHGAQYDPTTKLWNFPISEHGKLLSAMEPMRPAISLGALPPHVLKIFRAPQNSKVEYDLSRIDPVLVNALMPFQKDGVIFGISRNGRVLIADDMGLGKTIQALGVAHYFYSDWPLLIVAPSSMRYGWREAIWNWLPSVNAGSVCVMESSKDYMSSAQVVIISYDLLQKKQDDLMNYKTIIMDESHHLKNFKTVRTKAAMPIIQNSRRAILLSGTPALSRPSELYPQLAALSRNLFNSHEVYGVRYCNGKKNAWGWDFSGSSNMQELNLILEETVMIRRLKSDVLKQLPPKVRQLVVLDPAQIKLTSAALKASANAFNEVKNLRVGESEKRKRMLAYYVETANVKLPAVSAYIKDLVEAEKKFICFAHHRYMLDGICSYLDEAECKYIRIDGSTSSEDRQSSVDEFQDRGDIRVAVLSIVAANSGVTLTAAGLVVFAELYWNPGILTQAEDRAHRIGQEDSVSVQYLIAKGTADDVLWPMVQEKLNVLNKAGLSKDNFQDAEASGFVTTASKPNQKGISDYFSSQSSQAKPQKEECINSTDEEIWDENILLQLMEESFDDQ